MQFLTEKNFAVLVLGILAGMAMVYMGVESTNVVIPITTGIAGFVTGDALAKQ